MIDREIVPVAFLVWTQNTRAVAERTDALKCRKDCPADKFRAIGKILNESRQIFIYLERDNLLLFPHSLTIFLFTARVLLRITNRNNYHVFSMCQEVFD